MPSSFPAEKLKKRGNVVHEVYDTEELYVSQLNCIVSLYQEPLLKNKLIPPQDVDKIFSNIEQIRDVNVRFLEGLREALGTNTGKPDFVNACVGEPFLTIAPFFKVYTDYVNNQELSNKTLTQHVKSSSVRKFFKANEDNPAAGGLDIESLLITPVQRIPRYKLLLESLLKNTPDNHPDKILIPEALQETGKIANLINKAAREAADYLSLVDLQKSFQDSDKSRIAAFGRRLIKKGILKKICRSSDKEYTFFLFNDMLLYASGGSGLTQYKIHARIPVNRKFIIRDTPDTASQQNRMEILNTVKSFVVIAQDSTVKQDWLKVFEDLSANLDDELIARSSVFGEELVDDDEDEVVAIWDPDNESTQCRICAESFNVLRRRHHCRKCGDLVCGPCSRNELVFNKKAFGGKPVRICDRCFTSFKTTGEFPPPRDKTSSTKLISHGVDEGKDDDSGDEADTLGDKDSWFEATTQFDGNPETQELTLRRGNRIAIQHKDASGFWFGINLATREVGWLDPAMIRQIIVTNETQQRQLEDALRVSLGKYQLEAMESETKSSSPMVMSAQDMIQSLYDGSSSDFVSPYNITKRPSQPSSGKPPRPDALPPVSSKLKPPWSQHPTSSSSGNLLPGAGRPAVPALGTTGGTIPKSGGFSGNITPIRPMAKVNTGNSMKNVLNAANSTLNGIPDGKSTMNIVSQTKGGNRIMNVINAGNGTLNGISDTKSAMNIVSQSKGGSGATLKLSKNEADNSDTESVRSFASTGTNRTGSSKSGNYAYSSSAASKSFISSAALDSFANDSNSLGSSAPSTSSANIPSYVRTASSDVKSFARPIQAGKPGKTRIGEAQPTYPKYKVIIPVPGNAETKELALLSGDIITILKKDDSGFWYGKGTKSDKSGWIDPANLEPI